MFFNNKLKAKNVDLETKLSVIREYNYLYGIYRYCIKNIIECAELKISFIPFSEWTKVFDKYLTEDYIWENKHLENYSEEIKNFASVLKTELEKVAFALGYIIKDVNNNRVLRHYFYDDSDKVIITDVKTSLSEFRKKAESNGYVFTNISYFK